MVSIDRRRFLAATGLTVAGTAVAAGTRATAAIPSAEPHGRAGRATIIQHGSTWVLENEVIRVAVRQVAGSIALTSLYNKEAGREYLTGSGASTLFRYELNSTHTVESGDGGWTPSATARRADITMHSVDGVSIVGRSITFEIARRTPVPMRITLVFEIYDDRSGVRYYTLIANDSAADEVTVTKSTVIGLNVPNDPHVIYYPPNANWKSTVGSLSPDAADTSSSGKRAERPKKAITVYDSGDGWTLSPELNWKTMNGSGNETNYMLPPFAGINVWSGIDGAQVDTHPESLQLVLFPREQFEYLSVNLTVFVGDVIDGKMSVQEHFRRRFRFNHVSALIDTNDWNYRGGPGRVLPTDYYYTTIIPKAKAAGLDMVMLDDLWNTTRDTIVPSDDMAKSIGSLQKLSTTLRRQGLKFGLWFNLAGDAAAKGRDLADPRNIAVKRAQIETLLTVDNLAHHMIDLTEYWQNQAVTTYSHPSDNVYRKAVMVRAMLNELVVAYPQYLPKLTSELDIWPTQGDRNVGLIHLAYNGWNTPDGGVTGEALTLRTGITHFGHVPMEATYTSGGPNGTMSSFYAMMFARNVKFADDPGDPAKWPASGIALVATFNAWRKSRRIVEMTEELFRPVYLGAGWDGPGWNSSSGPYVWLYTDEQRTKALMIASAESGSQTAVVARPRWLAQSRRYAVCDISFDDTGTTHYAYRGTATGEALRTQGIPIELSANTSPSTCTRARES